ncbi:MAG TPA: cysteine synthase family protein [Thermoguttaceae bacterium]|nr:cysteine synthase family protein [Thermoguttaceae bacterium]
MAENSANGHLESSNRLRRFEDIRELIANPENPTPIVKIGRIVPPGAFQLYLKLEWFNPFGSIKDRTASFMLRGMQERGELDGKSLVEPSSGNTGIALAAIAALMGKKLVVTIPDGVPEEKKLLLRMLGAEVWPTPDDLCPIDHPKDGAIALAHSFVRGEATQGEYAMPYQYENADNVKAHYETTGPEIWKQTEGQVKYFIAGYGTCGTLTGTAKFLKQQNPEIKVIAVEPRKGHKLPGLKNLEESKVPGILDRSLIDEVIPMDDEPAYQMTKRLFREEGLIVGPTTGAIVAAAAQFAQGNEGLAVAISPDSGLKYTSYFADVLGNEGMPQV